MILTYSKSATLASGIYQEIWNRVNSKRVKSDSDLVKLRNEQIQLPNLIVTHEPGIMLPFLCRG